MTADHEKKPRVILPDLEKLGKSLEKIDHHFITLLAKRMEIARQVEAWKNQAIQEAEEKNKELKEEKVAGKITEQEEIAEKAEINKIREKGDLVRPLIEKDRLKDIFGVAEEKGLNGHFAQAFLYLLINESCRVQITQREKRAKAGEEKRHKDFRQNLLDLTREIAPLYDKKYGEEAPFSTTSYISFENGLINTECGSLLALKNTDLAIDLGCANGRVSFMLSPHFKRVIGYDISPQMIGEAYKKKTSGSNVEFTETDIEKGIPLDSNSVSFAVMNLGTASDMHNLKIVMADIKRVLKEDGRFLLSFYNSAALIYHWFLPWMPSLTAGMNLVDHCLDVSINQKIFQVYARSYSIAEVEKLIVELKLTINGTDSGHPSIYTYPTIASILPDEFFEADKEAKKAGQRFNAEIEEVVKGFDGILSSQKKGAYLAVTGRKS